jgi:hypothetical protein
MMLDSAFTDDLIQNIIIPLIGGLLVFGGTGIWLDGIKNSGIRCFILGILLGPLGLIIGAILPGNPKQESASASLFPEQPAAPQPLRLIRIRDDDPVKIKRPPRSKAS